MKFTLLLLSLAIEGTVLASTNDSNDIARVRGLISNAETQALSVGARDAEGVVEVFQDIYRKVECVALQDKMVESWLFVLHHLNELTATESGKAMVMISTGKMTVPSYLEFLNNVAELVDNGTLDRKFFMWAQFPPEGGLCNVLIKHHAESKAQTVILRAKKIFQDDPGKVASYDAMLTGESKKELESYEARLAPPSSVQLTGHENERKSPTNNRVPPLHIDAGRTPKDSCGSIVGNGSSPLPPPPVRTATDFMWSILAVLLAMVIAAFVWFLRRR